MKKKTHTDIIESLPSRVYLFNEKGDDVDVACISLHISYTSIIYGTRSSYYMCLLFCFGKDFQMKGE